MLPFLNFKRVEVDIVSSFNKIAVKTWLVNRNSSFSDRQSIPWLACPYKIISKNLFFFWVNIPLPILFPEHNCCYRTVFFKFFRWIAYCILICCFFWTRFCSFRTLFRVNTWSYYVLKAFTASLPTDKLIKKLLVSTFFYCRYINAIKNCALLFCNRLKSLVMIFGHYKSSINKTSIMCSFVHTFIQTYLIVIWTITVSHSDINKWFSVPIFDQLVNTVLNYWLV